jgi:N-acetylmuramoyl-L-alanine amidase
MFYLAVALLCINVALGDITGTNPPNNSCLCVAGTSVNVRSTACGAVIGQTNTGSCYTYRGQRTTCVLSGVQYDFYNVNFGSGGWIAGTFLNLGTAAQCQGPPSGCPRIVTRAEWGARAPTSISYISHPVPRYFVHHTETGGCSNQADCSAICRSIQNYHMNSNGWSDIGYNFLVGGDGNAYEGRGWDRVGAHATNYNSVAIGVSAIGSFMNANPNNAALTAIQQLISCGISLGKLSSNYSLHGHRDGVCTDCPGNALYNTIRTWPRYGGRLAGGCALEDDSP